jgi:hypothetical protein
MIGLIAIFVSPILVAWLTTSGYVDLVSWGRTNRGSLITPPLDLRDVADTEGLFERANLAPGEWLLLLLPPPECAQACAQIIERLTTIRRLLGYSGQRVHILSLSGAKLAAYLKLNELLTKAVADIALPQILFLDWREQLVLRFDADAPSIDVKKDIKRLLQASKIR